jgi:hypothetical protein
MQFTEVKFKMANSPAFIDSNTSCRTSLSEPILKRTALGTSSEYIDTQKRRKNKK